MNRNIQKTGDNIESITKIARNWIFVSGCLLLSDIIFIFKSEEVSELQIFSISFLAILFFILIYVGFWKSNEQRTRDQKDKEEKARIESAERIRTAKKIESEKAGKLLMARNIEIENRRKEREAYQKLRKEIEQMPKYNNWRNLVFQKYGNCCEICGSIDHLEIHHRKSFGEIIKEYKIDSIMKAFSCNALWDVDNGSVLCRDHHKETSSYIKD